MGNFSLDNVNEMFSVSCNAYSQFLLISKRIKKHKANKRIGKQRRSNMVLNLLLQMELYIQFISYKIW